MLSSVSVAIQAAQTQLETDIHSKEVQHTRDDGGWEGDNLRHGDFVSRGDILGLSLLDDLVLSDWEH